MSERTFKLTLLAAAAGFTLLFSIIVIPAFLSNPDIFAAFGAGFVNPYAAGYSTDILFCWAILAIWIFHDATTYSVKHGWVCLLLGIVPGVAVGFALYLVIRNQQITQARSA